MLVSMCTRYALKLDTVFYRCSWAKLHQTLYRTGGVVVPDVDDDIPVFHVIEKVIFIEQQLFLLLYDCPCADYYPHFHSYGVTAC